MRSSAVVCAVVGGAALGWWLRDLWRQDRWSVYLRACALLRRAVVFRRLRVPVASLCGDSLPLRVHADAEGLVEVDIRVEGGDITHVHSHFEAAPLQGFCIDAGGAIALCCFVDAHTHLIKTHTVPRNRNATGTIGGALACEVADQPRWNVEDISRRMGFGIRTAYHHGSRALRTHLDGTNSPDPALRAAVYTAFDAARTEWAARGLELQGVANLYLPLWRDAALSERHVAEAASHSSVLLGAYCGNVAETPSEEVESSFDALFAHAARTGLAVDLHIDETNEPRCCALVALCASLRRARLAGYRCPVVLGHATALSLQTESTRRHVISALRELEPISVVANPHTNLGLMDRRGTDGLVGQSIDAATPRTPLWRGVTQMQELRAAGVRVAAASDNVRDWWYSLGDYDLLEVLRSALQLAHLDTSPTEGAWADLVTHAAAAACGLPDLRVAAGDRADLILFPSARRMSELLARRSRRIVLRAGVPQTSALPSYRELDELVAELTPHEATAAPLQRGATVAADTAPAST